MKYVKLLYKENGVKLLRDLVSSAGSYEIVKKVCGQCVVLMISQYANIGFDHNFTIFFFFSTLPFKDNSWSDPHTLSHAKRQNQVSQVIVLKVFSILKQPEPPPYILKT